MILCICVTKGRADDVERAVRCWRAQSVDCELLLVHQGLAADPPPGVNLWRAPANATLGELRNAGLDLARVLGAEFWAQWDDDDEHHPDRLAAQLEAIGASGICMLSNWTIRDERTGEEYTSHRRWWEGSMICRTSAITSSGVRFPHKRRYEDTTFVRGLMQAGVTFQSLARPDLYTYRYHPADGGNTCDDSHFERLIRLATPRTTR